MEIKHNKDKSVTINATNDEYLMLSIAMIQLYNRVRTAEDIACCKAIVDAMNNAYNEQVLPLLNEGK